MVVWNPPFQRLFPPRPPVEDTHACMHIHLDRPQYYHSHTRIIQKRRGQRAEGRGGMDGDGQDDYPLLVRSPSITDQPSPMNFVSSFLIKNSPNQAISECRCALMMTSCCFGQVWLGGQQSHWVRMKAFPLKKTVVVVGTKRDSCCYYPAVAAVAAGTQCPFF